MPTCRSDVSDTFCTGWYPQVDMIAPATEPIAPALSEAVKNLNAHDSGRPSRSPIAPLRRFREFFLFLEWCGRVVPVAVIDRTDDGAGAGRVRTVGTWRYVAVRGVYALAAVGEIATMKGGRVSAEVVLRLTVG